MEDCTLQNKHRPGRHTEGSSFHFSTDLIHPVSTDCTFGAGQLQTAAPLKRPLRDELSGTIQLVQQRGRGHGVKHVFLQMNESSNRAQGGHTKEGCWVGVK